MFMLNAMCIAAFLPNVHSCAATRTTSPVSVTTSCSLPFSIFNNGAVVPNVTPDPITAASGASVDVTCTTTDTNINNCFLAMNIQDGTFVGSCSSVTGICTATMKCNNGVYTVQGNTVESITCGCHTLFPG